MKKFFILHLLLGLLLTSFSGSGKAEKVGERIKLGFVLGTLQEERYQRDQRSFKEAAVRMGFEAVIVSSDSNEQTQQSKVESLLAQGVKALVIQPVNSDTAQVLVKMAHAEHVPVVAYDRMIYGAPVDFFVTQDSFQVGVLQAEAVAKALNGKGNVVLLVGQEGHSVAVEITKGIESVLSKYPLIKVVMKKNHAAWSPSLAMATVENALAQNKNNIQAVLANNSGMAQGAIQALAECGLAGKVFVAGADSDLAAIKEIVAGRQHFEVLKDIEPLAATAANVAYALAKGEKPTPKYFVESGKFRIGAISTPVYSVTKENLEFVVFRKGFHSRSAVFGTSVQKSQTIETAKKAAFQVK